MLWTTLKCNIGVQPPLSGRVHKRGGWVTEEWLHWTETCSHVISQPYENGKGATVHILHDPSLRKIWTALQVAVKHFMRADMKHWLLWSHLGGERHAKAQVPHQALHHIQPSNVGGQLCVARNSLGSCKERPYL